MKEYLGKREERKSETKRKYEDTVLSPVLVIFPSTVKLTLRCLFWHIGKQVKNANTTSWVILGLEDKLLTHWRDRVRRELHLGGKEISN